MRVLHLTRDFPPRINGGISTAVGGWVREAARRGIEQAVISFDGWRPREDRRLGLGPEPRDEHCLSVLRIERPADVARAHELAAAFRPDLLHVHQAMLWPVAEAIAAPATLYSMHVDHRAQARLRGGDTRSHSERLESAALAAADVVTVPCTAMLERQRPALGARVRRVPLGVDLPPAEPPAASLPRVLYAGRFADIKGTGELFAAIEPVLTRVPAARFELAGGLPDSPKRERRWRRRFERVAGAGARRSTRFAGWLAPDELRRRFRTARLFAAPSWIETFGLAVLEAMACSLPVVGTACEGIGELVEHGREGLLVPPRDVPSLVDALTSLLRDPERAAAMGARARERAAAFSWSRAGEHLIRAYAAAAS